MIESIQSVQKVLQPHHELISECIHSAWSKWKTQLRPLFPMPSKRVRANVVYDLMVDEARRLFSSCSQVKLIEGPRILLSFGGSIIVRFKLIGDGYQTRNYPTQSSLNFDSQFQLPAVPKGVRITVGYKFLNSDETEIQAVVLFSKGKNVVWHYELDIPQAAQVIKLASSVKNLPVVQVKRVQKRNKEI